MAPYVCVIWLPAILDHLDPFRGCLGDGIILDILVGYLLGGQTTFSDD